MLVPDLEGLIQEAEDQAAGNTALVPALDCVDRAIRDFAPFAHILPHTLQVRSEAQGRKHRVDVMPGVKAVMAAYEHGKDDTYYYKVGKLRELVARLKAESEDTK